MNNFDLHDQAQQLADTRSAYSLARELLELKTRNSELVAALTAAEGFVSEVSEKTGFGQDHTLKVVRAALVKQPQLGVSDQCDLVMRLLRGHKCQA